MSEERKKRLLQALENQRKETAPIVSQVVLIEIQGILEELVELIRLETAEGLLLQNTLSITPSMTELNRGNTITMPWKAITIYNDGPAPFFIGINRDYIENPTPINIGQPFNADFGRNKIQKVLLTTTNPITQVSGGKASIRLFAIK